MPEITTPRELFLHELGDILYVEQRLTEEVLPTLIHEVQDADFRSALLNSGDPRQFAIDNGHDMSPDTSDWIIQCLQNVEVDREDGHPVRFQACRDGAPDAASRPCDDRNLHRGGNPS